jgi:uncharacterized protein YyaL (SSP411 family)
MFLYKYIIIISLFLTFASSKLNHKNALQYEISPYLLQHSTNPVNWYAWNKQSLQKAKDENKLIFLSIGYSTCHWCHVMEEESFANADIAKLFNQDYISIKVDRELMSDLDIYYQNILRKIKTRRNGWPLSVILTPQLEVLHITTYIPSNFNYGTEGLDTLLPKFANIYNNDKKVLEKMIKSNQKLINSKIVQKQYKMSNIEKQYVDAMSEVYDDSYKGFFKRPRFPLASNLNFLYDIYDLTKNKEALKMVYEPLTAMAKGGIYDQIDGAFFRYSVHPDWIIPHFEKMLYTQAELIPLYTRAYLDTNNSLYKKVVVQSLKQVETRFAKDGLFYSASDASSENSEGKYYVYDYDNAYKQLLNNGYLADEINRNLEYLDIYEVGNFKNNSSNIHFNYNDEDDIKPKQLDKTLKILKGIRAGETYPFIDKKIMTSWNAMMIKAYFKASSINKIYQIKGLKYLDNLLNQMYIDDQLYHFKIGENPPKQKAILEDYAFLIDTLLEAYQMNLDTKYLILATKLTNITLKKFYKNNTWYLSDENIKIKAKADFNDKYYTSALAQMFHNLISVANLNYDMKLLDSTKQMIKNYSNQILSNFVAHPQALKVMVRIQKGDVILKSNRYNLISRKDEIRDIKYPFLLTSYKKSNDYLACDEKTCFSYDQDFSKVKTSILQRLKREY